MPTHAVTNQVPPLPQYNALTCNAALAEALRRWADSAAYQEVEVLGRPLGLRGSAAVGRPGQHQHTGPAHALPHR
ncbi:hypothetical protein [Pedococcus sp. 5OH_020]|uniref:hypothetical protein n=1 Tax=Pedococcus sp. 5OH_020 TaxID=2989814 RepID=UPI0022E9AB36|nr:hypothetical protein [Pedococcus sp. 5OH_020]